MAADQTTKQTENKRQFKRTSEGSKSEKTNCEFNLLSDAVAAKHNSVAVKQKRMILALFIL